MPYPGVVSPTAAFSSMLSTFALSGVIGYQVVWGVAHSLHSPLMAVTNAISGMTAVRRATYPQPYPSPPNPLPKPPTRQPPPTGQPANPNRNPNPNPNRKRTRNPDPNPPKVGGIYVMGGGLAPSSTAEALGALATGISAVNITGGFLVTKKMLDMFKRPDDPPEYYEYYAAPAAAFIGGYSLAAFSGSPQMSSVAATVSALGCIGGIGGLANQSTARMGNVSGMCGVSFGLAATIGSLDWNASQYVQLAGVLGSGGALGYGIAKKVDPTSLPQTVAAFHSLVGLAAVFTGVGDYLAHSAHSPELLDGVRLTSIALASVIGSVTATGSLIAFGKLNGSLKSDALSLPMRDPMNMAAGAATLGCMGLFIANPSPATGLAALMGMSALSGLWAMSNPDPNRDRDRSPNPNRNPPTLTETAPLTEALT